MESSFSDPSFVCERLIEKVMFPQIDGIRKLMDEYSDNMVDTFLSFRSLMAPVTDGEIIQMQYEGLRY